MHWLMFERQLVAVMGVTALVMVGGCTEPEVRIPAAIEVEAGANQQAEVGERLAQDIVVRVTDSQGRTVRRAAVTFEIATQESEGFSIGSVDPVNVMTDGEGVARTRWTLGTKAGEQALRASVVSTGSTTIEPVTVSATAQPGAIATLAPAADRIVAITVGDSVGVGVAAKDQYGNVVSTPSVTWQVTDQSLASIRRTEGTTATVLANAAGTTVLEVRDLAGHTARFDLRTYVGPGRDIAYELNGRIYLLSADGRTTTALGTGAGPAWSPDGRQIAFVDGATPATSVIHVMNADGSGRHELAGRNPTYPAWSPDGRRIAFGWLVSAAVPPNPGPVYDALFVINPDGSGLTEVVRGENACLSCIGAQYPSWSPDGTRIGYVLSARRSSFAVADVRVVSADGTGDRRLTTFTPSRWNTEPAWSPDGQRVAFASAPISISSVGYTDLYVVDGNGTVTRLTSASSSASSDRSPSWAPDGRVVFVRRRGIFDLPRDPAEIFVVNADGSELRRVATVGADVSSPQVRRVAWRPGN